MLETYDFYATDRKYAIKKMEKVIHNHLQKYWEKLEIKDLRKINDNLWRCNLTLSLNQLN